MKLLWKKIPAEIRYIAVLFLTSRLILISIGLITRLYFRKISGAEMLHFFYPDHLWLDIWGAWDTGWYLNIANEGYSSQGLPDWPNMKNYCFFPLYPLMMRYVGTVLGNSFVAGILISNISFLIACYYLYKLVRIDDDHETALGSIKYLFLMPCAFMYSGVLSEGLFTGLLVVCFYHARKGHWGRMALCGFFLTLTRPMGVVALFPLLYLYLQKTNWHPKKNVSLFVIPLTGIGLWCWFNYILTGDFLAFAHGQAAWGRVLQNPVKCLWHWLNFSQTGDVQKLFESIYTIILLVVITGGYRLMGYCYWLWSILSILVPFTTGVGVMPRHSLVNFPLPIFFARLTRHNPQLDQVLTISLALIQGFLMVHWTTPTTLVG